MERLSCYNDSSLSHLSREVWKRHSHVADLEVENDEDKEQLPDLVEWSNVLMVSVRFAMGNINSRGGAYDGDWFYI